MELKSTAFKQGEKIPEKYTCADQDVNPPLTISDIPSEAKSLALIMEDPDAPSGTWVHWVMWNIDPKTSEIEEGIAPENGIGGKNSSDENGYHGPCPPPGGPHRYFFKIYALDTVFNLPADSGKEELTSAMESHILSNSELMGTFGR